jgi:hypothetical protein
MLSSSFFSFLQRGSVNKDKEADPSDNRLRCFFDRSFLGESPVKTLRFPITKRKPSPAVMTPHTHT